jgi:predicted permease
MNTTHTLLIQEGYLALGLFVLLHIVGMLLNKYHFKREVKFSPFKSWSWNKPPDNYRSLFYVDVFFGTLFLIMAIVIINALGYAIMLGYLSLICWIIALRLFFRIRKLEHGTLE